MILVTDIYFIWLVVAIVQLSCMLHMPESPVWLRQKVHSMEFDPDRNANHCLVFICAFISDGFQLM